MLSKACWRQVWSLTEKPIPLCMIPSGQRCCFNESSIAGSWAAGRYLCRRTNNRARQRRSCSRWR
ncbi:hypothetical protein KCP75_08240 [Salmonella enterica subsp. enterica]|nr:hypothetical protein KCP75_08240 [Salmonella enterica subsp. enterica]